jgi:ferredoxin
MSHSEHHTERNSLAYSIEKNVEVHAQKCYQCGKCTAGCPVTEEMDLPPSMVMRLLQTEDPLNDEKILRFHLALRNMRNVPEPLPYGNRYPLNDGFPAAEIAKRKTGEQKSKEYYRFS